MPINITGNNNNFGAVSEGNNNNVRGVVNGSGGGTAMPEDTAAPPVAAANVALLRRQERETLIEQLMQLPNIRDARTRELLLTDLPPNLKNAIPASTLPRQHITEIINMVDSEAWRMPANYKDNWPLLIVIENALNQVSGSNLGKLLKGQLDTLRGRIPRR